MTDLSLVVFATADHLLDLHGCIFAAARARAQAQAAGHAVQSIVAIDPGEAALAEWCQERLDASWEIVACGDSGAGLSEPKVWQHCRGRYLAWTDGRDLWSANWLRDALARVRQHGGAWHPEVLLTYSGDHFSNEGRGFRLLTEQDGELSSLLAADTLPAGFVCERSILAQWPFPRADAVRGLGDANRWWHCQTAAAGVLHGIVPATFHYRRLSWAELNAPPLHPRARARYGAIALSPVGAA
jgi:hypothetical protein